MSAQHTPGPWASLPDECDKPYIRIRGTQLGSRYKIANVLTPVYEAALRAAIAKVEGGAA